MERATLYVDLMSQPSRACVYFAHLCALPVEIQTIRCTGFLYPIPCTRHEP